MQTIIEMVNVSLKQETTRNLARIYFLFLYCTQSKLFTLFLFFLFFSPYDFFFYFLQFYLPHSELYSHSQNNSFSAKIECSLRSGLSVFDITVPLSLKEIVWLYWREGKTLRERESSFLNCETVLIVFKYIFKLS